MTVTILIGLPASGKSTVAKGMASPFVKALSSDAIREELYGDEATQGNPADVFSLLYKRLEYSLSQGFSVVIDATNICKRERSEAIRIAKKHGAKTEAVVMDTPIAECVRRNDKRERKVPDFVFDKMIAKYEEPNLSEGFDMIAKAN